MGHAIDVPSQLAYSVSGKFDHWQALRSSAADRTISMPRGEFDHWQAVRSSAWVVRWRLGYYQRLGVKRLAITKILPAFLARFRAKGGRCAGPLGSEYPGPVINGDVGTGMN